MNDGGIAPRPVINSAGVYVVDWATDDRFLGRKFLVEPATRADAIFPWVAKTVGRNQHVGEFDSDGVSRYGSFRLTTQAGASQ